MEKIITVGLDWPNQCFKSMPLTGMGASGSAHYWAQAIGTLGHTVRMMPPAYVKAYVKRNKTDAAGAERSARR